VETGRANVNCGKREALSILKPQTIKVIALLPMMKTLAGAKAMKAMVVKRVGKMFATIAESRWASV
jgi:hypothetical protein